MSTNYVQVNHTPSNSHELSPFSKPLNHQLHIENFTDVIWVQTGFIGDIVLTTAAILAISKLSPNIRQHLITTKVGAEALKGHPLLENIFIFAKRDGFLLPILKVRSQIKKLKLQKPVILQPHLSLRSTFLGRSLGAPTVTFQESNGSWMSSLKTQRVALLHESCRNMLLLESLGLDRRSLIRFRPDLSSKIDFNEGNKLPSAAHWVGVVPGSVWGTKRWPAAKFASVVQMIMDMDNTGVVLIGSSEERSIASFIEEQCYKSRPEYRSRLINLVGKTALTDLCVLYPQLKLVISNDSSSVHYASAFNVPTIEIFGATVPSMGFGPLADRSEVAEISLPCRPCSDHGPKVCPLEHFKCMNDLETSQIMNLVRKILSK